MEKETRITPPEGCEIEKVEIVDGVAVVTFKKKERQLPKSWEEFCEMSVIKANQEFYIDVCCGINVVERACGRDSNTDKNLLPDRATAEAVLALCQLIQLRDCYNGDWVPDWKDRDTLKYSIDFLECEIKTAIYYRSTSLLYFKTEELRAEFLRNFRPLIEKLKPLYGIKEGGEE